MKLEETSENIIHFKVRTFAALIVFLVGGTNVVNTVVHNISDNRDDIEYNAKAEERRRNHMQKELQYERTITHMQIELDRLNRELKECKDD